MHEYLTFDTIFIPHKRAVIKEAIEVAWRTSNPDATEFQRLWFPLGKPTVGVFIITAKIYSIMKILCA